MMKVIRFLQEASNTVIIVEHDREVILAADHLIDMGPGAGKAGGQILAAGTPEEVMNNPLSPTGQYLSGNYESNVSGPSRLSGVAALRGTPGPGLSVRQAFANNLKGFDLEIPSGGITVISGVSGSGKSSLLFDVILSSLERKKPAGCSAFSGAENFHRYISLRQHAGFNSSLATPATYTGLLDRIRELMAALPEAKLAGIGKNAFSYADKAGRCPACEGTGKIRVSMDFLPDVSMTCEQCHGKRYRPEVLAIELKGKNIADILEMTFTEACVFFGDAKTLSNQLQMLEKVGLGYLQAGQPLDILSGGESQRLVLATELMKPGKGATLYLFDEPTTGLNFRDVEQLLLLFRQLADQGNTLVIIEHDPEVIRHADYLVELGPEGGEKGGFLLNASGRSL
jgi:excinuclease ABC subunit A